MRFRQVMINLLRILPLSGYIYALIFGIIYVNIFKMFQFHLTNYIFIIVVYLSLVTVILTTTAKISRNTTINDQFNLPLTILIIWVTYLIITRFNLNILKLSIIPFMLLGIFSWIAGKTYSSSEKASLLFMFPLFVNVVIMVILIVVLTIQKMVSLP